MGESINFIQEHINIDESFVRNDILLLPLNDQEYYFSLKLRAKTPLDIVNMRHTFYQEDLDQIYNSIASRQTRWAILIMPKDGEVIKILNEEEIKNLKEKLNQHYQTKARKSVGKNGEVIIFERKS